MKRRDFIKYGFGSLTLFSLGIFSSAKEILQVQYLDLPVNSLSWKRVFLWKKNDIQHSFTSSIIYPHFMKGLKIIDEKHQMNNEWDRQVKKYSGFDKYKLTKWSLDNFSSSGFGIKGENIDGEQLKVLRRVIHRHMNV